VVDTSHLDDLTQEECLELLRRCTVGRLAVAAPGSAPLVVPVNYVVDGEAIVFRSRPGEKLDLLARGPVSFQIDDIDHARHLGWSVLVRGHAAVDASPGALPDTWLDAQEMFVVRLVPESVSGRRIVPAVLLLDARGYM
jgi:hypothetical protein